MSFDFSHYLATRRSTPFPLMGDPGPTPDQLAAILKVAARVPDHGKLAPWRFIIIPRAAGPRLNALCEAWVLADDPGTEAARIEKERTRFTRAPVCVALVSSAGPHPKIPEWEQVLSAGAVGLNLVHAAAAWGFGANWVTEWCAYDRRMADHLGLAAHEKIAGFIHIGTPSGKAEDRARPDMATITSTYGS
jgi:nitroreductase